jgi:hypothetical protein
LAAVRLDNVNEWFATLTKDDFLQDTKPYEWLYSLREDAFMQARMQVRLAEVAKACKVTNFGKLWSSYLQKQKTATGRSVVENVTEFGDDQPLELKCGDYDCSPLGVTVMNQNGYLTRVCSHPIMPTKRLINIESGEVKLEIGYKRRSGWRNAVFDKQTLSNARSITTLATSGISVTSESAKDLVRFLAYLEDENFDEIPEVKTVGRLGWVDGYGFSPYVDGLLYDSAGMYGDAFSAVRQSGSYAKWLKLALEVRAGKSVPCRIILAASFASPLVAKTGALPFILHLWGSVSGIGKSVALILAASVWAYPEIGSYVKTTKSTNVGYEQMAAFCGHLPLCMDELQMIQGKKEFDELIYSLCEGVSKTRGAKMGGVQQVQRWRNAILTTGEMPITTANSKAGAVNRVIEVECQEKLFPDPREAYQTLVQNYGHAGRKFVEMLTDTPDALETMQDMQAAFYEQLRGKATDKQILTASLILTADAMAELFLFDDGHSLTAEDILPYLTTSAQADTNRRAYDWICDWIASNPMRFDTNIHGDYSGECWGQANTNEGKAYIIRSVFNRAMTDAGFNPDSFLSWAGKAGLVERQGKHLTKVKRIKGLASPARCVCLTLPDPEAEDVFDQMESTE